MSCIVCGANTLECLDLNQQPLANNLLTSCQEKYEKYELGLDYCVNCGHGQLKQFVEPSILFKNYLYASGTSNTLKNYFRVLAQSIAYKHGKNAHVLDIASNDGSFLKALKDAGINNCIGIDPAENLVEVANSSGCTTICDFFPSSKLVQKFDVIVAMNVCAHNPDPVNFLKGIRNSLKDNGVAYIQTSQALMLNSGEFDTIYHEHYSFFTINSMRVACKNAGLYLSGYELANIHGVSFIFRVTCFQKKSDNLLLEKDMSDKVSDFKGNEIINTYNIFKIKAKNTILDVQKEVNIYREKGFKIVLAGVAAKALTFYHAANLHCDLFIDEAPLKIGKFVPGMNQAIESFDNLNKNHKYLIIIGAWNFFDEIKNKITQKNPGVEIIYLRYFPTIQISK